MIMMESRHKKCTWMPSLAPEVVAESQVGRRSVSSKLSSSGLLEANEASSTKSLHRAVSQEILRKIETKLDSHTGSTRQIENMQILFK